MQNREYSKCDRTIEERCQSDLYTFFFFFLELQNLKPKFKNSKNLCDYKKTFNFTQKKNQRKLEKSA